MCFGGGDHMAAGARDRGGAVAVVGAGVGLLLVGRGAAVILANVPVAVRVLVPAA